MIWAQKPKSAAEGDRGSFDKRLFLFPKSWVGQFDVMEVKSYSAWQIRPCPTGCCHFLYLCEWLGWSGGSLELVDTEEGNKRRNKEKENFIISQSHMQRKKKSNAQVFKCGCSPIPLNLSWCKMLMSKLGFLPPCRLQRSGPRPCRSPSLHLSMSRQPNTPSPPTAHLLPSNYDKKRSKNGKLKLTTRIRVAIIRCIYFGLFVMYLQKNKTKNKHSQNVIL